MPDATLLQKFEELSVRVAKLEADNTRLENENRLLRQKLDQYIRHHFGGQRNEGLDKHQLELLLQGLPNVIVLPPPECQTTAVTRRGVEHPVRRMLVEDRLETYETVIEPAEVQANPEGWKKISEERTSQLDWVAPKIIKRVLIRPRYVKAERFAIAPLPPQPIEQGMVGPGLLAQIVVSKYEWHQPLYRQEKMFREQFGVNLSRKTMGCWVEQAAELLKPVYRAIREDLLQGNYLQADETPIRYLNPDVKGKSRQGYLWTYGRPRGDVLFEWRVNRSREGPEEFLKSFRGKLQTDGYAAYESLAKERGDLTLIGCWAHARRGFHEALAETKLAAWFVYQIGLLYDVERALREQKAGPALRETMRVWQAQPDETFASAGQIPHHVGLFGGRRCVRGGFEVVGETVAREMEQSDGVDDTIRIEPCVLVVGIVVANAEGERFGSALGKMERTAVFEDKKATIGLCL